jgi:hypothetical protein
MSITYAFDPESGVLRTRCAGHITLEDTLEHFRQIEADDSLPDRFKALLDVSQLESLPETRQLRAATSGLGRMQKRASWGPWAIVAERDAVYGLSRMFQVFLEELGIRCRVFRSRDAAEDWLASPDAPSE